MPMFRSEFDLLKTIDAHDALVHQCVNGQLEFESFCKMYNDFYNAFALDGHESNEDERFLLQKHKIRIEPHRIIAHEILSRLCADEDALKESYRQAGRICSTEALKRLKHVKFSA